MGAGGGEETCVCVCTETTQGYGTAKVAQTQRETEGSRMYVTQT